MLGHTYFIRSPKTTEHPHTRNPHAHRTIHATSTKSHTNAKQSIVLIGWRAYVALRPSIGLRVCNARKDTHILYSTQRRRRRRRPLAIWSLLADTKKSVSMYRVLWSALDADVCVFMYVLVEPVSVWAFAASCGIACRHSRNGESALCGRAANVLRTPERREPDKK